jgi:hypothetical protein
LKIWEFVKPWIRRQWIGEVLCEMCINFNFMLCENFYFWNRSDLL